MSLKTFKDDIDKQIGTPEHTLHTLRTASVVAALAGLWMIGDIADGFMNHHSFSLLWVVLGPYLLIRFGGVAWRTHNELKIRKNQQAVAHG